MIKPAQLRKQVLVVDDDDSILELLRMLLEIRGYEVHSAHSAQEAFQKVSSHIDIILLDIVLPDSDGFIVCQKLRGNEETRLIPIIMLSVKNIYADKVEALYLGADDFLCKPFENEELFARMEAVLRRSSNVNNYRVIQSQEIIVHDLRRIIDQELVVPVYQPIYWLKSLEVMGIEVLSRPMVEGWLSNPDFLFKSALQFGFYQDLELLVWRKALKELTEKNNTRKIFLNCDPYLVEGLEFYKIQDLLDDCKVSADNIFLEITERSAVSDHQTFYRHLCHFRDYGFRFAVDDVGGGYASLESIVNTKPEVVKVDRHIITDIKNNVFKRSIVKFVVSFCRENNIISVAEGLETLEDLQIVRELGVDAGQGYFLGRPSAIENFSNIHQKIIL